MMYQLSIRAEKLPRGWLLPPDPYVTVTISGGARENEVLGESHPVSRTTQPAFAKIFFLEAPSGAMYMPFRVEIFNNKQKNGQKLAEASFEATEVYRSPGSTREVTTEGGAR